MFQISALPAERFRPLYGASDEALAARGVRRVVADSAPGFPCRVSLQDASIGEPVLLMNFQHHAAASPYAASHAIFVREGAETVTPAPGEVPMFLNHRTLSVRGFDSGGDMISAELCPGADLAAALTTVFASPNVHFIHLHNAAPGCFAARVDRA